MVAERIGRTSPSIYLHFPDKASLMWAVCERQYADFDRTLVEAVGREQATVARLAALLEAYVRFATEHPEQFRILFLADREGRGGAESMAELADTPAFGVATEVLARGASGGELRADLDPVAVLLTLWATAHGIATLRVVRPGMDWPELSGWCRDAAALLMDGLARR